MTGKTGTPKKKRRQSSKAELKRKRTKFLELLLAGETIDDACKISGLPSSTAYRWRHTDPGFKDAWARMFDDGNVNLEQVGYSRAVKDRDTTMIIFLMKTRMREKYGADRKSDINVGNINIESLTGPQLNQLIERLTGELTAAGVPIPQIEAPQESYREVS